MHRLRRQRVALATQPARAGTTPRPGHLVDKPRSGQICPRTGVHLGNVGSKSAKLAAAKKLDGPLGKTNLLNLELLS